MSVENATPYEFSPLLYSAFKYDITNWISHILRRNCLLRQVIEGKIKEGIKVTGRRGRRRRNLLDDLRKGEDAHI
jgi:hypothetical protein